MQCTQCDQQAVLTPPARCKEHLIEHVETTAEKTIFSFNLLQKDDQVVVAASGGKDSTTLLNILKKLGYNITALAIDEGIEAYRPSTLNDLRTFCSENSIPLRVLSYKEAFGFSLDEGLAAVNVTACQACGVLRRYLLNAGAKGFDKVATGHNLDDEAQSIMMNMLKGNLTVLSRLGPRTGTAHDPRFVPRVKPLYFLTEKEIATYAVIKGFDVQFTECPNAGQSQRSRVRTALNNYETDHPGTKRALVDLFLDHAQALSHEDVMGSCTRCHAPSASTICKACKVSELFATALH